MYIYKIKNKLYKDNGTTRAKSFILHEMLTFQESMEIDFLNKTQGILYLGFPYLY